MFYIPLPKQQNEKQFGYPWHAMVNVTGGEEGDSRMHFSLFHPVREAMRNLSPVLLISLFAVQGNYLCTSGTMAINFSNNILRLQLSSNRRIRRGKNRTSCTSNASLCENICFEMVIETASTIEKFRGVRGGLQFIFFLQPEGWQCVSDFSEKSWSFPFSYRHKLEPE